MLKKDKFAKLIFKKKIEWEKTSKNFEEEFKQSGDPKILIGFIKQQGPNAIKEKWVLEEIAKWLGKENYQDKLKEIFLLRPGQRTHETSYLRAIKDLMLMVAVDELKAQGISRTKAFEKLKDKPYASLSAQVNKQSYYRAKKSFPDIYSSEDGFNIGEVKPTLAELEFDNGETIKLFGTLTYKKDKED